MSCSLIFCSLFDSLQGHLNLVEYLKKGKLIAYKFIFGAFKSPIFHYSM
ncbi:hypothetical protein C943_04153 [Mariniradius saccharolyticus AK6]|uniref:Uncharacterized protein n=1 Tax=Mariniradius saccharolyticus AK6 TaxID=1239962 RepID=M7XG79_9BACT|nr:hypothetical protein C943_04153 [Mariniradius saccharolyticus AK6]